MGEASSRDSEREPGGRQLELDAESHRWLADLRAVGAGREEAVARLHALLLRAARYSVARHRPLLPQFADELEEIAVEAANDATVAVLARLDDYRGASRFTTWAYKFGLLTATSKLRRRAWQGREIPVEPETWTLFSPDHTDTERTAEIWDLLHAVRQGIDEALTPRQRNVLVAAAINGVPIEVLAGDLGTTRGAIYKTLHDARNKLRTYLADRGFHSVGGA